MQYVSVRKLIFPLAALLMVITGLFTLQPAVRADYGPPERISGHVNPLLKKAKLIKPTNPSVPVQLSVGLQPRNQQELNAVVNDLYDPSSPFYHQYLTPQQFRERYAPTEEQVAQVSDFLKRQGLDVTDITPNNMVISAMGTVKETQKAFNVHINDYSNGKQHFYANADMPTVPGHLKPLIAGIGGMDTSVKVQPRYLNRTLKPSAGPDGWDPSDIADAYNISSLQNAGFLGDNQTIALFAMDGFLKTDISAYVTYFKLDSLGTTLLSTVNSVLPTSSTNQTATPTPQPTATQATPTPTVSPTPAVTPTAVNPLAVTGATPTPTDTTPAEETPTVTPTPEVTPPAVTPQPQVSPNAVTGTTPTPTATSTAAVTLTPGVTPTATPRSVLPALSAKSNNILGNLSSVLINGFDGTAGQSALEVEMDIEIIASIAPRAKIVVYQGPNTVQGLNATYSRIVDDNKAQIVSISWGLCESSTGSSELQVLNNIFKQGAAQGMSFFAASGDAGAYDCHDNNLGVSSPASDPNVTGVGGTTLKWDSKNGYSEDVWSDPKDNLHGPNGAGSGGGISSVYKQPSWQRGPGVKNEYSNGNRQVPDVAAVADPNPGIAIYCTVKDAGCPSTGWVTVGGTSAAAPIWAGGMALVNQYMQTQAKKAVGVANTALYDLYNGKQTYDAFHDVTSGNNNYYPATSDYDLATGLGTADFYNIARDLVINASPSTNTTTSTPTPTPTPSPTPGPPQGNGTVIAQDTFQRSDQTYWGKASDGQSWQADASTNNIFSISSKAGKVTGGTASYSAILGPKVTDGEVVFTGSTNTYLDSNIGSVMRWTDNNNWYKAYIDGASLLIQKRAGGTIKMLSSASFTAKVNTAYTIRFRVVGTTLQAKVWAADGTEPTNWMVTTTDSALTSGNAGLRVSMTALTTSSHTWFQAVKVN